MHPEIRWFVLLLRTPVKPFDCAIFTTKANCFEECNVYGNGKCDQRQSNLYSLLHPIARASVKDGKRNRHLKTGTKSEILCTWKMNHWQDRRYSELALPRT